MISDIKVLDLTRVLAGPLCGQNLSDLGAEVLKIERPLIGDSTRAFGPFVHSKNGENKLAAFFTCANKGKKSMTLDLSTVEGQEIIKKLIVDYDVIIENYKVGDLKRYGLDYESLKKYNEKLIYCSITGFGQTGPYKKRAAYDLILQGMGGLMSISGKPEDEIGSEPQRAGVAISDIMAGMHATSSILSAIYRRKNMGLGCRIDVSLLDVQIATLANIGHNYLFSGEVPKRNGNAHATIAPNQTFQCKDGYINIVAGSTGGQFEKLCTILGAMDVLQDERFKINQGRNQYKKDLISSLQEKVIQWEVKDLVAKLEAVGVPCGPVNNIDQIFQDEHVIYREVKQIISDEQFGDFPVIRNPVLYDGVQVQQKRPPILSEHTDSILRNSLLMSEETIAILKSKGIV